MNYHLIEMDNTDPYVIITCLSEEKIKEEKKLFETTEIFNLNHYSEEDIISIFVENHLGLYDPDIMFEKIGALLSLSF